MGQKLLVVDDDAGMRTLLSHVLREAGYTIVTAGDGMSAIDSARRENPDLILLDLVLPMGDGFVVMQRLKQIPAMASIPIIAFSGMDEETNRRRALAAGANIFLSKPIETSVMLEEIKRLSLTQPATTGQAKKKILVIDNEPELCRTLSAYLKQVGYNVAVAADSATALSVVLREKPDAILLDIGLTGGDGMIILDRLKANSALNQIPVIMMSGQDPAKFHERSLNAGAAAYLSKPFKNEVLLKAIRGSLGEA